MEIYLSSYLSNKNKELINKPFNDWYIDDLLWIHKTEDEYEKLIDRNYQLFNGEVNSISDDDGHIALKLYNNSYNVLIRGVLDYLISCSKFRNKSNLINDFKEYLGLYFRNINDINGGLPAHNFVKLLKWTTIKFPESKMDISNSIFENIMALDSTVERGFYFTEYLLRDSKVNSLLNIEQYYDIFCKYYVSKVDYSSVYLYLDIYYSFAEYTKKRDKKIYKKVIKFYCDFVINNIDLINDQIGLSHLSKTRKFMDEIGCYSHDNYFIIDSKIEKSGKDIIKNMHSIKIDLPEEHEERLKKEIANQQEIFNSLENDEKIELLLFESFPISVEEIKKNIENRKGSITEMCSNCVIDSDGRPIYYSDLNDDELFSSKAHSLIGIRIPLYFQLHAYPFFNSFTRDDASINYVHNMLVNNKLVPSDKIEIINDLILDFFEQKFRFSIYEICLEIEDCIRFYFKSEGMNIYKTDGSGDFIGLNNIFNNSKLNTYRDKLLEIIDEDFYFTLKWFLTDDYGFGLRNKIAHRYQSNDLYKSIYSVFTVIQIIRLIWGFQN